MKEILLKMLGELEDLRANQVVLGQAVNAPLTTVEAREAKGRALKQNSEFFDTVRKQIEALA